MKEARVKTQADDRRLLTKTKILSETKVMEYKSNTKELQARIKRIRDLIAAGTFSDALTAGLNAGMGVMKRRIFNQSLAANDQNLGKYFSKGYAAKRKNAGRQISKKDLEFTGSLRRSIEVVTVNNTKAEIRITNDNDATIARHLETQTYSLLNGLPGNSPASGKLPIFELSNDELEIVRTNTRELLKQKFNF